MTVVQSSYYGRARRNAYALWRGSHYMLKQDDEHSWSGFCVLRLAICQVETVLYKIESRASYASYKSLVEETRSDAVLRGVYWDPQAARGKSRDDTSPIRVPARFVQIPVSLVLSWLHAFDTLQTAIRVFPLQDDDSPICSLHIATEANVCAFEKVWQVPSGEQDELTRLWREVWQAMGSALRTSPVITGLEESFPCVEGKPEAYDLQAYEPSLTLP